MKTILLILLVILVLVLIAIFIVLKFIMGRRKQTMDYGVITNKNKNSAD